ncbi:hypothetical protein POM88_050144 [Heracleum sosnowskyi]|uniref:Ubiquitin-like protease family profile domain-containing protein n=1 Tax=Heracleum sosnowskyi TaxID=360622 RepID=A0AAD8GYB6_9APIA|nr:hypothetical protein POM88_050144 [Heracleum sosnowskyi]
MQVLYDFNFPPVKVKFINSEVGTLRKNNEVASDVKYLRFESKLDFVLEKYEADINNIDMMFFPIHHVNHYYVVCFNIKNTSIDLLDNYKHGHCLNTVYEGYPESLQENFARYMSKFNEKKRDLVAKLTYYTGFGFESIETHNL